MLNPYPTPPPPKPSRGREGWEAGGSGFWTGKHSGQPGLLKLILNLNVFLTPGFPTPTPLLASHPLPLTFMFLVTLFPKLYKLRDKSCSWLVGELQLLGSPPNSLYETGFLKVALHSREGPRRLHTALRTLLIRDKRGRWPWSCLSQEIALRLGARGTWI